jgi:hypothetical protein
MPKHSKHHGVQIVRYYRAGKVTGKVKRFLGKVVGKLLVGSSVGLFILAGFACGNALSGFNGFVF